MSEQGKINQEKSGSSGRWGFWIAIIGALLIIIDGIAVLAASSFYGWHYGGISTVGWTEITISIIMFIILPFYKRSPAAIGWTTFVLALITMPFDGGFWEIGAILALIGGVMVALKK
ncbi:MAG: hypothetical protein RAK20_06100 [Conexivisphaerales archaeon]|nr:hypothetical protein [Conexivisphaerales archaeon]